MNSAKNPLQLLLLFVLMFFYSQVVKKPVLVQQNQIKTGLEIKQKVFRKNEAIKGKTAALRKPGKKRDKQKENQCTCSGG